MKFVKPITRRESIRKLLKWSGCLPLAAAARWPLFGFPEAKATVEKQKFIIEGIGQTDHFSVKVLTQKVFEAAGGLRQFVSKGDVVVVKPNISWARPPKMAATTDPESCRQSSSFARKRAPKRSE